MFEVVAALKIEGVEGIGEVKGEVAVLNANLTTGMCSLEYQCCCCHSWTMFP